MKKLKQTIASTNQYMKTASKRRDMIVDAVYSSAKIEGSKTTKTALKQYYTTSRAKSPSSL